jgi:hypothetical protein
MFSTRLEPQVMAALKAAAEKWPGGNVSTLAERLIHDGLREREEAQRDPAIKALLFMIAQLAERVSGAFYMPDKEARSRILPEWRTHPFRFKAFKLLVQKLLDSLEEPAGEIKPLFSEEAVRFSFESMGMPAEDIDGLVREDMRRTKTPEAFAATIFGALWAQANRGDAPLHEIERKLFQTSIGKSAEREYYALPGARRDLELKKHDVKSKKSRKSKS